MGQKMKIGIVQGMLFTLRLGILLMMVVLCVEYIVCQDFL